jgi:hypothetical protein
MWKTGRTESSASRWHSQLQSCGFRLAPGEPACQRPLSADNWSFTRGKPSIRPACAYTQASRTGESCRAVLAFSPLRYCPSGLLRPGGGFTRSHEQVCACPHADRPGSRVAGYCPVISQWRLLLSAYAEDRGREPGDECAGRTLRSSKSEGG